MHTMKTYLKLATKRGDQQCHHLGRCEVANGRERLVVVVQVIVGPDVDRVQRCVEELRPCLLSHHLKNLGPCVGKILQLLVH